MSHLHSQMRRALLIAYYFPPIAATGGMRPLNFCRNLASYGWAPKVLATDHGSVLPPPKRSIVNCWIESLLTSRSSESRTLTRSVAFFGFVNDSVNC